MSPRPPADSPERPYEVAIVGNDAVLAALPSRPMQLAHALLACGFDLVVPVSWGEELVAEYVLRAIAERGSAPAILCACPLLRERLLASGSELAPHLLSAVSPVVAAARYLRALHPDVPMRITVVGGCPGVRDVSIDSRIAPLAFLRMLSDRGLSLVRQPAIFESVIPPDRRRFLSLPGGCPTPRALQSRAPERRLVTITDDAFTAELADHLMGQESVLIDLSARLACACCGGFGGRGHRAPMGREEILRHEPPRARSPIVDHDIALLLEVGEGELRASPTPSLDDVFDGEEEEPEAPRLPGAQSIDALRPRVERQRIAVTPAAAVSPVVARRPTRPSRSAAAWGILAGPPVSPTTRPESSTSAVEADDSPPMASLGVSAGLKGYPAAPEASRPDVASPVRIDVVVALTPQREGMPQQVEPTASQDLAPFGPSRDTSGAAPPDTPLRETPHEAPHDAPLGDSDRRALRAVYALVDVDVADTTDVCGSLTVDSVRLTGRSSARFRLSRAQLHPRVRSLGGQVVPRAYIRHAVPVEQRQASGAPTAEIVSPQHLEVEVRVGVTSEPMNEPAGVVIRQSTSFTAPRESSAGPPTPFRTGAAESTASHDRGLARSESPGPDRVARMSAVGETGDIPPARGVTVPARGAAGSPPPRDVGSMAVIVATAVLVVAILILLAVTVRWAPTAPWQ